MRAARTLLALILGALCAPFPVAASPMGIDRAPDRLLEGVLQRTDHQTWREIPFDVPAGVGQLRVVFSHATDQGTVIDLGLRDPERFRGWSGGNKSTFTVGTGWATPSYLSGPMPEGTWQLLLGIPNIRTGVATAYRAEIFFSADTAAGPVPTNAAADAAFAADSPVRSDRAGWYRGDFHAHSGHSDGVCAGPSGARGPCPIRHTLESAAARGLDFVSLTEHNTRSHSQDLATLQFGIERMLVITGVELTTFSGHANLFGGSGPLDFPAVARDLNRTITDLRSGGGLVSINHPGLPSDERCLGCGWTASVDPRLIDAVEIVNGGSLRAAAGRVEPARADVRFWEALLNAGYRVTGIGGSDNHDALLADSVPSAIGRPTTVVFAHALSAQGILDGVRRGRVFIDVEGAGDRLIDLSARIGDASAEEGGRAVRAEMGESLCVAEGAMIDLQVRAITAPGDRVILIQDGKELEWVALADTTDGETAGFSIRYTGSAGWVRAESRSMEGAVRLLSNPVYLRCDRGQASGP